MYISLNHELAESILPFFTQSEYFRSEEIARDVFIKATREMQVTADTDTFLHITNVSEHPDTFTDSRAELIECGTLRLYCGGVVHCVCVYVCVCVCVFESQ